MNDPVTPPPPQSPADRPPVAADGRPPLWRNWVSLAGAVIAAGSALAFLLLFAMDVFGRSVSSPYVGILCYVVAPGFLLLGCFLVAAGAWWERRRRTLGRADSRPLSIDLSRSRDRWIMIWFGLGTMTFLLMTAVGSYQTYAYTESVEFCGETCHKVMGPELTAYRHNPHARVACVACHVGSGATWYVKTKINGMRQLYGVLFNRYSRPIGAPVENLRPARDTCEQCHWPDKFSGGIERKITHYLADDTNTPYTVQLLVNVGGADPMHGPRGGIHWHMLVGNKVEYYATDRQRQVIPWIRITNTKAGSVRVFRTAAFKGEPDPKLIREMDCIDCHNRPAHRYSTPNAAVEAALFQGTIDPAMPAVKKTVVDLLTKPYKTEAEALAAIDAGMRAKYGTVPAEAAASAAAQDIYKANFFPEMKADWSQYPDNIGHLDSPGCFRCHDSKHVLVGGKDTPGVDCNTCHTILSQGSGAALGQISPAGQAFQHPSSDISGVDLTCADCHNGKNQDN